MPDEPKSKRVKPGSRFLTSFTRPLFVCPLGRSPGFLGGPSRSRSRCASQPAVTGGHKKKTPRNLS